MKFEKVMEQQPKPTEYVIRLRYEEAKEVYAQLKMVYDANYLRHGGFLYFIYQRLFEEHFW